MRCKLLAFILALLALGSVAGAAPPVHAKATLLADVKQIVPGKPFHLGVLVEIDPGWHIYWLNPGDSGMATKIKLDLPKGLTAGDVQFPTPIKMVDPGNINVYGYTDKVMFIATVTPDKSLAVGEADLSAKVSHLVCKDVCVPGKATVDLKLPITAAGADEGKANEELFTDWIAQLPVAPAQSKTITQVKQTNLGHNTIVIEFGLHWVSGDVQVFPGPNDDVDVEATVDSTGDMRMHNDGSERVILHIKPLAGHTMPAVTLPVVIGVYSLAGGPRSVVVQIDLGSLRP